MEGGGGEGEALLESLSATLTTTTPRVVMSNEHSAQKYNAQHKRHTFEIGMLI